jgi:hypothetical protein
MSQHNHITRDIKPEGQCPACDDYHDRRKPQPLTSLDQLKVGTMLKVVSDDKEYSFDKITVKKLIPMFNEHGDGSLPSAGPGDTEILLDKKKNTYFSMNKFLKKTSWAKEIYVYQD